VEQITDEFRRAAEIEANTPITAGRAAAHCREDRTRPKAPGADWGWRELIIFLCIVVFGIGIPIAVALLTRS